ncbi:ABC transporter substrate-binding protein [Lichenifustis flavocetrariae]|uniref:ABC transporter substrate-binding protein n=1 Tax=Lichenifustis flavocetrariae TaxID=2949735 RepID=A0AA41YSZ7_9HYPH|nr:ABC transporter substrate-binding protein [Lichenifustis flavocetrariae]MCW6506641.1 ABC transporter substrate-binding protein [Lichenifustis flavocetrariae]
MTTRSALRLCAMVQLSVILAGLSCMSAAMAAEHIRIGLLSTGTVAWQIDTMRRHGLDAKAGLDLETVSLASPDAAKLALNAGSVDLAVTDWLWVVRERSLGAKLLFYPYSTAAGAVMARGDGGISTLRDLRGKRLAVAGGPLDKSWLIVQAAALKSGLDLSHEATLMFGAPPLIYEKTRTGEADASLEFWNYCAQLDVQGFHRVLDVAQAERDLGVASPVAFTGYVFSEDFAKAHKPTLEAFLRATQSANAILAESDAEWDALRPLMHADDEALFKAYRDTTRAGIPHRPIREEAADAERLFSILAATASGKLVGSGTKFDPALYYRLSSAVE